MIAITERLDPVKDDFRPEILAQAAERQLVRLGEWMTLLLRVVAFPAPGLTYDLVHFGSLTLMVPHRAGSPTRLLRSEPTTLYEDSQVKVGRARESELSEYDWPLPVQLLRFLKPFSTGTLLKPFSMSTPPEILFSVVSVDAISDDSFTTTVLVTAWGESDRGLRQQNATWRITWLLNGSPTDANGQVLPLPIEAGGTRPPVILSIEPLSYEETVLKTRLFADCTESVLGAAFDDRLRLGTDYWSKRLDRLLGSDMLGHTGLCIGDVNNDGLDDVYVAQPGGLPNMLLVHNPDGTVTDRAKEAHVDFLDMTRGCLFVDLDNDGDQDLALSIRNATVIMENDGTGIFKEKPVLSARTGTPSEFYSIAAADYDHNGFLDLYSTRYVKASYGISIPIPYFDANNGPPNHLLANLGGWKFDDVTERVGLDENNRRFSLAASWEDFDDDGDQDLYVANDFGQANFYVNHLNEPPNSFGASGGPSPLDLGKSIETSGSNPTSQHTIDSPTSQGGGPPNETGGQATFTDEAAQRGAQNRAAGMGVSWADYDRDGIMDLYVSNMYSAAGARIMARPEFRTNDPPELRSQFLGHVMGNALFHGLPGGRFENASSGLRQGVEGWSWGSLFVDINNDGLEDILVPNGNLSGTLKDIDSLFWRAVAAESPTSLVAAPKYDDGWTAMSLLMLRGHSWAGHQRNATYLNLGNGQFADISAISGFGYLDDGRALAVTDWDHDGDLDVWIKNRTGPMLRFLRNDSVGDQTPPNPPLVRGGTELDPPLVRGGFGGSDGEVGDESAIDNRQSTIPSALALLLEGTTCNHDAIGARVTLEAGGRTFIDTARAGEGYLAQSTQWIHFFLPVTEKIESVAVRWPGGTVERFEEIQPGGRYILEQGEGQARLASAKLTPSPLWERAGVRADQQLADHRVKPNDRGRDNALPPAPETEMPRHIVLQDRLALPGIEWSDVEGRRSGSESRLGRSFAWVFWSARSPESVRAVQALQAKDLTVEIVPICVDGSDAMETAKAMLAEWGISFPVIPVDVLMLDLIDLMQQEILAHPDDLLLPTVVLVDRLGLVVSLQRGGTDIKTLVDDINRNPEQPFPAAGRILFKEPRNYAFMADELRKRGHAELFDYYRQLHARRPQRPPG